MAVLDSDETGMMTVNVLLVSFRNCFYFVNENIPVQTAQCVGRNFKKACSGSMAHNGPHSENTGAPAF